MGVKHKTQFLESTYVFHKNKGKQMEQINLFRSLARGRVKL